MAGYNNFPGPDSKIQVCVVDSRNATEDHSCNYKGYSPVDHGDHVDPNHLADNPFLSGGSGFFQEIFGGVPDSGTPILLLKQLGMNGGIVIGQTNTVRHGGTDSGGSGNLDSASTVSKLTAAKKEINVPPDIQEATAEDGTKYRKVVEKGKQHALDLLDGLPLHGALFDMAGFKLPDIKGVPTAKQTNDGMMNSDMLQGMMGQIMSLGQMFQSLAGNGGAGGGGGGLGVGSQNLGNGQTYNPPGANTGAGGAIYGGGLGNNSISAAEAPKGTSMYSIMEGLSPQMKAAVNSLSVLVQGLETSGGVAYFTGDVVHEETYLQNAQELLSQVTTLDDLMYVVQRLQWDTTLFGREKLSNVVNEIQTAWGTALQEVDYNGNIVVTYGTDDANAIMEFTNSMTSNTSSPALGFFAGDDYTYSVNATGASQGFNTAGTGATGTGTGGTGSGGGGSGTNPQQIMGQVQGLLGQIEGLAQGMSQNMFGESAGTIKDMWQRMTREQENDAKKMHQKLNQDSDVQKMAKIIEKTVKGGNPIDMMSDMFDENNLESIGDSVGSGNFSVGFM